MMENMIKKEHFEKVNKMYCKNVAKMNDIRRKLCKTSILLDCCLKEIIDSDNNTTNFLPLVSKDRAGNELQFRPFLGEVSNLCYCVI